MCFLDGELPHDLDLPDGFNEAVVMFVEVRDHLDGNFLSRVCTHAFHYIPEGTSA